MEYKKSGNVVVLRLAKGEEVVSSLTTLMEEFDIKSGRVSGIGASDDITIGVYDVPSQTYYKKKIEEDMEILSLSGNLSRNKGIPYIHIHGAFASLGNVYGGHVNEVKISATAEIIIDLYDIDVEREFDKETGLNLIKL